MLEEMFIAHWRGSLLTGVESCWRCSLLTGVCSAGGDTHYSLEWVVLEDVLTTHWRCSLVRELARNAHHSLECAVLEEMLIAHWSGNCRRCSLLTGVVLEEMLITHWSGNCWRCSLLTGAMLQGHMSHCSVLILELGPEKEYV